MNEEPLSKLHYGLQIESQAEIWFTQKFPSAQLLNRNYRARVGEIDLIFEVPGGGGIELVFVEVRARLEGGWEDAVESVGLRKRFRLRRVIDLYLSKYKGKALGARLDILAWDGKSWEHLPNVWI